MTKDYNTMGRYHKTKARAKKPTMTTGTPEPLPENQGELISDGVMRRMFDLFIFCLQEGMTESQALTDVALTFDRSAATIKTIIISKLAHSYQRDQKAEKVSRIPNSLLDFARDVELIREVAFIRYVAKEGKFPVEILSDLFCLSSRRIESVLRGNL